MAAADYSPHGRGSPGWERGGFIGPAGYERREVDAILDVQLLISQATGAAIVLEDRFTGAW
jgi:hypothetical protein